MGKYNFEKGCKCSRPLMQDIATSCLKPSGNDTAPESSHSFLSPEAHGEAKSININTDINREYALCNNSGSSYYTIYLMMTKDLVLSVTNLLKSLIRLYR